jgi:hypothetical protein
MSWLTTLDPPVPNTAPKYWTNVGNIVMGSRFQLPPVGVRGGVVSGAPPSWQPPVSSGQSADAILTGANR